MNDTPNMSMSTRTLREYTVAISWSTMTAPESLFNALCELRSINVLAGSKSAACGHARKLLESMTVEFDGLHVEVRE